MTTQHGSAQQSEFRNNAAELAVAIGSIPAPMWFATRAETTNALRATVEKVLAGSSWREPDAALHDCALARDSLDETAKLVTAALEKLDQHSRSRGFGAVHRGGGRAAVPQPQHMPAAPPRHTLREISIFLQRCISLLDPAALHPTREQLQQAHSGLSRASMHERGGALGPPMELSAATNFLKQAGISLTEGIDRLTASHRGLQAYLMGAIGTSSMDRSRRPLDWRGKSGRVNRKLREARRTARGTDSSAEREKADTQRVERRNGRRSHKVQAQQHSATRDVLLASLGTAVAAEPHESKTDAR
ncbi:MAG: hypothetical protein ACRDQZ_19200 [Mycobacteriales bacterium]